MAKVNGTFDGKISAVRATARGLHLANQLRKLREERNLEAHQVAERLQIAERTIQRIESAETIPREALLRRLLDLYTAGSEKTAALIEIRREAKIAPWWLPYEDLLGGLYVDLEALARTLRSYQVSIIPALLQTEEYAAAIAAAMLGDRTDTERVLELRAERRKRFHRQRRQQDLHVILDEAAVRHAVGGREVMLNQVGYLAKMGTLPHVTLQVVPFATGAHVGMAGSFVLMDFPEFPQVIYVETRAGDLYPSGAVVESGFNIDWGQLAELALSPTDTAAFLADLAKEWSGGT